MIQKIYEYVLDRSIDNIPFFNFLTETFPQLNKKYMDRLEKEIAEVYIPQEELDRSSHNVWQKLCDDIPTLDRSKVTFHGVGKV